MIRDVAGFTARLDALVNQQPDSGAAELAAQLVREVAPAARCDVLGYLIEPEIEWRQRAQARHIEAQARSLGDTAPDTSEPVATQPESWSTWSNPPEPANPADFQRLYEDPELWTHEAPLWGGWWVDRYTNRFRDGINWEGAHLDQQFRDWCEDTHGRGAFNCWLDRALLLDADTADEEWVGFEHHWLPEVTGRIARRQRIEEEEALRQKRLTTITQAIEDFADGIRIETTAQLLDSIFALGDGTRVSWRDATVAQHEERADFLTKMIAGTSETAAMHIAAVRMIKDAGADTLGQLNAGGVA